MKIVNQNFWRSEDSIHSIGSKANMQGQTRDGTAEFGGAIHGDVCQPVDDQFPYKIGNDLPNVICQTK